jgi:hypothetical protein
MERYHTTEDWTRQTVQLPTDPPEPPALRAADPVAPIPAPLLVRCGLCGSPHVLVVGLAWNMDHHTGDAHYGYEVVCEECHKFSAYAHVETGGECDTLWVHARAAQAHRRAARQTLLARITARLTGHDVH